MPNNIAEGLHEHAVPIDAPVLHPNNSRIGNLEAITESLQRFGQVRPIVVQRETGYVVAGNHTLKAARALEWDKIAAVVVSFAPDEAEAYLVADNRLADKGTYDQEALARQLEALMVNGKLQGTGYTPDEVDDMLSAMDALPEAEPADFKGEHSVTNEDLADVFKNRSLSGPLRQFVLMYTQEQGQEVEAMIARLGRAWGVTGARDVVREALRRAVEDPPVEGLSAEEKARADAPADEEVESRLAGAPFGAGDLPGEGIASEPQPEPEGSAKGSSSAPAAPSPGESQTFLERHGLVKPPDADTPPQPATLAEQQQATEAFVQANPPTVGEEPRPNHPASGNLPPNEFEETGYDGPTRQPDEPLFEKGSD